MKKNVLTLTAALALVLALAACDGNPPGGSAEDVIKQAQENMAGVTSMRYTMTMDMEMTAEGEDVNITTDLTADYIVDPMAMKMDMVMDLGEMGSMTTTSYAVKEDSEYVLYTGMDYGDGQMTWIKQTLGGLADLEQYNAQANLDLYLKSAESFKENGTETINGSAATRYDGVISKEALEEVLASSGMMDYLDQMGMDETSAMLQNMDDLPISIWVDDESLLPVKYEMDMSAMMQSMMDSVAADEDVDVTIGKVFVSMTVTDYNSVESIQLPAEAQDAMES